MQSSRFNSIHLAQLYYNKQYQNQTVYSPVVVLVRNHQHDHKLTKPSCIQMSVNELNQCVSPFTLILIYLEIKSKKAPTESTSEGELPGHVINYGFINSALLQMMAIKAHLYSFRLNLNQLHASLPNIKSHASFNAYQIIPNFNRFVEFTRPVLWNAISNRVKIMCLLYQNQFKEDANIISTPECTIEQLELAHLLNEQNVVLDHIVFELLARAIGRKNSHGILNSDKRFNIKQQWLLCERLLLKYRLTNGYASHLERFLDVKKYKIQTQNDLLECFNNSSGEPQSELEYWCTKIENNTKIYVICPFENATLSSGFTRRSIQLTNGFGVFSLVYSLPCILEDYTELFDQHSSSFLFKPPCNTDDELLQFDALSRFYSKFKAINDEIDFKKTQERLERGQTTWSELMQYGPSCIRSMMDRVENGTSTTRLKHNERIKFSQCCSIFNLDFEEIEDKFNKNSLRLYPNQKEAKGALKNLKFAYDRKANCLRRIDNIPSCHSLIKNNLCGHMKRSKRLNIEPQQSCIKELNARTQTTNHRIIFNPAFYFNQLKQAKTSNSN